MCNLWCWMAAILYDTSTIRRINFCRRNCREFFLLGNISKHEHSDIFFSDNYRNYCVIDIVIIVILCLL